MAENKSKDEIRAEIVENEAEQMTVERAESIEAAASPVAKKSKTKKEQQDGNSQEVSTDQVQATEEQEGLDEETKTAKAGKRSAKAIAEAEEKQAKEERKASKAASDAEDKPKVQQKPPRSKLERRGKSFRQAAEKVEADKLYTLAEAAELATATSPVKFDATVELHINLGVDPRQADQNIRATIVLPAGTGKTVRVAALTDDVEAAKKAGADLAGVDDLLGQIEKGNFDFDILVSTPANMAKLGKYARALGPKGLMPNPKSGTVTNDVAKAVKEAKAGRVEYRVDSTGIVHLGIGKVSFGKDKLLENAQAVMNNIRSNKPASVKGSFIKAVHITTSMGPSIKVSPNEI